MTSFVKLPPMHPGEVLREEFLVPFGLTAYTVAKAIGVPRTRIERIANETVGITGDTAVRLSAYFGTTPEFWMNLQSRYELLTAQEAIGKAVSEIPRLERAAA